MLSNTCLLMLCFFMPVFAENLVPPQSPVAHPQPAPIPEPPDFELPGLDFPLDIDIPGFKFDVQEVQPLEIKPFSYTFTKEQQEQIKRNAEKATARVRDQISQLKEQMALNRPFRFDIAPGAWGHWAGSDAAGHYRSGIRAVDEHEYEKAVEEMNQVLAAKSKDARNDGALYWKAYALAKLGRTADALSALAELRKSHPQSSWLNDARMLETEMRQRAGQAVALETANDDELKLLAINGLMNTDSARAIPMIERMLDNAKSSPRLRERALFVLARSKSPEAQQAVARVARGERANPDLQIKAVEYLALTNGGSKQTIADIYKQSNDAGVKRAALRSMFITKNIDGLLSVARTDPNQELRSQAIHYIGALGNSDALASLYQSETNTELRRAIIDSLFAQGNAQQLVAIARRESNPQLKRDLVQRLSLMKSKEASDYMLDLLR